MSAFPLPFESGNGRRRFEERRIELGQLFEKLPPHAAEAEYALLGSMIVEPRVCGEVLTTLAGPHDFYKPAHGVIYSILVELYDQYQSLDALQIVQKLRDKGVIDQVGGLEYIVELAESVPSAASYQHYARIVRDKAQLRRLIEASGKVIYDAYHADLPVEELLDAAERSIFDVAERKSEDRASLLKHLLEETYERLEKQEGEGVSGLRTGFHELDDMLNGLQKGEMIIVAARPSMGKAQPLDAKVLKPSGWTSMGELRVGDAVASVDGGASRVTGVYPQGARQVHRVTFADGRSAECCDEHLWRVWYRGWDGPRVLETGVLRTMLSKARYRNRLWIETFNGEFGSEEELPLDPWLLGFLLGDGALGGSSVRFSTADRENLEAVRAAVGQEMELQPAGGYNYRVRQAGGAHRIGVKGVNPNPLKQALVALGVWGCNAHEKFIPPTYLGGSRDARARLLAGLIDSDGWVESFGALRFATSSQRLAENVVSLMRSLGGTASIASKQTRYSYRGEVREGRVTYVCNLQHDAAREFATLPSKRARLDKGRQRKRRLNIRSIEPTRVTQTQCISVSHPSRLYVTDDYVVTHNTALALNMAENIAATERRPVAVFSLEMSKQQLAQRLLCSRSGVDSHKLRRNMLGRDDFQKLALTVGELAEAPMYIDDTPGLTLLGLRAKARRLAAQHQVQAIFVDYMQLMAAPGSESRQQEVSNISRGIKALARDLEVPVVCLSQLNRQAESREGHRPRMSDLRESGSIEQDADVVMMLHREDYFHKGDEEYEDTNVAEVIVNKQRNGPTGVVKLVFDGATTRFKNMAYGGEGGGYGGGGGGGGF